MNPFISILLPIRNEEKYICQTLDSILSQEYPADQIEILIADGMSTDATREIVRQYQAVHPNISLHENPLKIVPTGLRILISQARGEILIRIDGHTVIAPDYVQQCVKALSTSDAVNVGGRMHAIGENHFGEVVAVATSSPFGVGGGRFHYSTKEEWVDTVYMGAWRREVFQVHGLFDEELVRDQDDEFNYRLREKGGRILLSPHIKSHYVVRGSPHRLWKQYYQYGYWKVRVLQKHPLQMRPRQFVPALFVSSLALLAILSILIPPLTWLLLAAAALYLAANLSASLLSAGRSQWKYLPLLPLVFAILHISYGCGFLVGLIKFWDRWGDKVGLTPSLSEMKDSSNG